MLFFPLSTKNATPPPMMSTPRTIRMTVAHGKLPFGCVCAGAELPAAAGLELDEATDALSEAAADDLLSGYRHGTWSFPIRP